MNATIIVKFLSLQFFLNGELMSFAYCSISIKSAWPEVDRKWASGKRQLIEGVIWQLKDQFSLECHRARIIGGLLTRLAAKVAAYTCGQLFNARLGRPLHHFASLLIRAIAHQTS